MFHAFPLLRLLLPRPPASLVRFACVAGAVDGVCDKTLLALGETAPLIRAAPVSAGGDKCISPATQTDADDRTSSSSNKNSSSNRNNSSRTYGRHLGVVGGIFVYV